MSQAPREESAIADTGRVVAIGDLHGNHEGLRRILRETGLIDGKGRWAARDTHLVLMGDVLGRGGEPGKIFALVRRLEAEAPGRGSRVHLLLGNHEAMSIGGMLRYNTLEEFRDLAEEGREAFPEAERGEGEPAGPADGGREAKLARRLDMLGAREFRAALSPRGPVGAWLLSHATPVAINGNLFVHGGLNRAHGLVPLRELNARVRAELAAGDSGAPEPVLRRDGPHWNRDFALDPAPARGGELEEVLDYQGCGRMVVGHTPTSRIAAGGAGRILPLYGGRLYCIDTGIGRAYGGRLSALSLADGEPEPLYFR
jgi:hypothetical protein